jgi:predicted transport protein
MPLYLIKENNTVTQVKPSPYNKERDLQKLFEINLEELLDVRFIASEYTTGDRQRGRIDTLGLDKDGYPTIIEFKKSSKENIINQGLFYLDWLVDHRGDFTLIAQKACGSGIKIDWSRPRVILIAESFSEYDKYAVNRIGTNIELWTYRKYGDNLLYLDSLFVAASQPTKGTSVLVPQEPETQNLPGEEVEITIYTIEDQTRKKSQEIVSLFDLLRERIIGLADDGEIIEKANKIYIGYKHGKNFCEVRLQAKIIQIWLDIPTKDLDDPTHLVRDVSKIGHYGTGNSEIRLSNPNEIESVMHLIDQSFRLTL